MYRLKTEHFLLEFNPELHQDDFSYAVNTSLSIKVISYGFSAESIMDIDVRKFANFTVHLNEIYETLEGSARLEEPYGGHGYIEFMACGRGHIAVKGNIHNGNAYGYEQELSFENEIEQTWLKSFAKGLYANYKRYAET